MGKYLSEFAVWERIREIGSESDEQSALQGPALRLDVCCWIWMRMPDVILHGVRCSCSPRRRVISGVN